MALTATEYLEQAHAEKIFVVEITKSGTTYYVSDRPYVTESADTPASTPFAPLIEKNGLPRLKWLLPNVITRVAHKTHGQLILATNSYPNGESDVDLESLDLTQAQIVIKCVAPRRLYPYSDAITLFTGLITTQKRVRGKHMIYNFEDKRYEFDKVMVPDVRYSSGEAAGTMKPRARGFLTHAKAVLVDSSTLLYQVNDGVLDPYFPGIGPSIQPYDKGAQLIQLGNAVGGGANYVDLDPATTSSVNDFYNGCWINVNFGDYQIITDYDGTLHRAYVASWSGIGAYNGSYYTIYLHVEDFNSGTFKLLTNPAGTIFAHVIAPLIDSAVAEAKDLIKSYTSLTDADFVTDSNAVLSSGNISYQLLAAQPLSRLLDSLLHAWGRYWTVTRDGKVRFGVYGPYNAAVPYKTYVYQTEFLSDFVEENDDRLFWRIVARHDHNYQPVQDPAASVSAYEKDLHAKPYFVTSVSDTTLKANNLASKEYFVDMYDHEPLPALNQLKSLFGVVRKKARVDIPLKFGVEPGGYLNITWDDETSDWWLITSVEETYGSSPSMTLELWQ